MADSSVTETNNKPSTVKGFMAMPATQKRVVELLGDRSSQFMTSVSSMVGADDKLAACEPTSLFMACLTAAALDLPINKNLAFAHIIPYKNNSAGVTEAQFQMGWKGYVQLAQRSGQYKNIASIQVYEGQLVEENPLVGNTYDWNGKASDKVIGYVAYMKLANGFEKELFMTTEEVTKHAQKYSKAYKYGPWKDNFDAMALKTVIKLLLSKWGPLSVEMQKAITVDQGVIREDESVDYIDGSSDIAENAKASDETKNAIIEANAEPAAADQTETTTTEQANAVFGDEIEVMKPKKPAAKKSIKEQARERGWTKD